MKKRFLLLIVLTIAPIKLYASKHYTQLHADLEEELSSRNNLQAIHKKVTKISSVAIGVPLLYTIIKEFFFNKVLISDLKEPYLTCCEILSLITHPGHLIWAIPTFIINILSQAINKQHLNNLRLRLVYIENLTV